MRTPAGMAARMAGAIVSAVLAAAPGVAGAEDALPLLPPQAANEAAIDAIDASPGGKGSAIGGVPAEAVPAEPAAEDEGKEAARDVPDSESMVRAEVSPEPASRLLRSLAEAPKAPASPDDGTAGGVRLYAAEGCPRALLRRLLAGAADDAGALTALGIEREVLTLCRERQEIVTGLLETEARLRELRAPQEAPVPARTAAAVAATPTPSVWGTSPADPAAQPSPLRLALAGSAEKASEADPRAGDPRAGETQAPRYAWFSIIGTAGALRAGVTDGTGVWFVREGDALPGGTHVAVIAGRPPAVQVRETGDGKETPLPYRARPGGGP